MAGRNCVGASGGYKMTVNRWGSNMGKGGVGWVVMAVMSDRGI